MPNEVTDSLLRSGRLLLSKTPSEAAEAVSGGVPFVGDLLVILFILLFLVFLRRFLNILPFLSDSVLRARGSAALEHSVRVREDRNIIALILILPTCLLLYRYRLYDPDYVRGMTEDFRLLTVSGVFLGFLLLRFVLYRWCMPRRRRDNYQISYRSGHTFLILLHLLVLPTVGLLYVFHANDLTISTLILVESAVVYLAFLVRRGQILSLSCNPLTTFLYLCGLELLPLGLYVASALVL